MAGGWRGGKVAFTAIEASTAGGGVASAAAQGIGANQEWYPGTVEGREGVNKSAPPRCAIFQTLKVL